MNPETIRYTKTFSNVDVLYVNTTILKLEQQFINKIFQLLETYLLDEHPVQYRVFIEKELSYINTFLYIDLFRKLYIDFNKKSYDTEIYKLIAIKIDVIFLFINNLLEIINRKPIEEWEDDFNIILNDSRNSLDVSNDIFIRNIRELYPDLKFINEDTLIDNYNDELDELENIFDDDPLKESNRKFTIDILFEYEKDYLHSILKIVSHTIIYNEKKSKINSYIFLTDLDDNRFKPLFENQSNGYITKESYYYMNETFYYQFEYTKYKQRYIQIMNLKIIPLFIRLHYAHDKISIDNMITDIEYPYNNKYSPYSIQQLYIQGKENVEAFDQVTQYKKDASLYYYVIKQHYSLSYFFNIFNILFNAMKDTTVINPYETVNNFILLYIDFDKGYIFSRLFKVFEKLETPDIETDNITEYNDFIDNQLTDQSKDIYLTSYRSILRFRPILYLIQYLINLNKRIELSKNPSNRVPSLNHIENLITNTYNLINNEYNITNIDSNIQELLSNINNNIYSTKYSISTLILFEKDQIFKIINILNNSINSYTGLFYKELDYSEIHLLTKFYEFAYIPYLLQLLLLNKRDASLMVPISQTFQ